MIDPDGLLLVVSNLSVPFLLLLSYEGGGLKQIKKKLNSDVEKYFWRVTYSSQMEML
jgi:hypothetical protein